MAKPGTLDVTAVLSRVDQVLASRGERKPYFFDPVGWCEDRIAWKSGEGLTDYQKDVMTNLISRKRAAVRGPHGMGKTTLASLVLLWFAETRDGLDWKAPITASAWRQLTKFFWPEVHKWARRIRWDRVGRPAYDERVELLQLSLKLSTGEAFAAASDQPALIEGAHADHILYIFDEAKRIKDETFDAAEGAFSGAGDDTGRDAYALCISTPGEPHGRFYAIHARKPGFEDWWTRQITLRETIAAKRVSEQWADQRKKQWGEASAVYQNRVLGEFASSEEDSVIPLAWLELANERWLAWKDAQDKQPPTEILKFTAVGADIARSGADKTVFAPRLGMIITELRRYSKADTMETANRLQSILQAHGGVAVVDVIGIGAGPYDRLRELDLQAIPFNASAGCKRKDQSGELGFVNLRSAAYWHLREILDPSNGFDAALPPDDLLTSDLTAPHWRVAAGGKIQVEGKDDTWADESGRSLRERLGRSPDDGDAVVMAFAAELISGGPHEILGSKPETDEERRAREEREEKEARERAKEEVETAIRTQGAYWPNG